MTTNQSYQWRAFCSGLFSAAVGPVLPINCLPPYLPNPSPYSAVKLIALGKGAAAMARVIEDAWPDVNLSGIAVCRDGCSQACQRIEVIECAHPVPDERSVEAAERALTIAADTGETELLLVLLSGGGSSLACLPAEGLSLADKQSVIRQLMLAGADIRELNTVRKQLSRIKGGRLAAAANRAGRIVTLAISDVVGDEPCLIASGPTVPDTSTKSEAMAILSSYGISLPRVWAKACEAPSGRKASFQIVANAAQMLAAAQNYVEEAGYTVKYLGDNVVGEAREVARHHALLARNLMDAGPDRAFLLLSGGELTSTVTGDGQGGPNQEYILALASEFTAVDPVYAFAADTDGMDGTGGAAGAISSPDNRAMARASGLDAIKFLNNNDSYRYFNEIDGLFKVKPTLTNVNDLRVIAIAPKGLPPT